MRSRGSTATATSLESSARTHGGRPPTSSAESKFAPTMTSFRNDLERTAPAETPLSKRAFDVLLSGAGLVLALPVGAAAALAIKLGDGGPIFFSQERVGKGGRSFRSYKFRSMVPHADKKYGTVQAGEHDPRVTAVGRILRKTAMDELPQLWNIFRGDMSFVGPRALAHPGSRDQGRRPFDSSRRDSRIHGAPPGDPRPHRYRANFRPAGHSQAAEVSL